MPFKTRSQKLKAAQRRFTYNESGLVTYSQEEEKEQPQKTKTSEAVLENLGYVKTDLVKILIFAFLIIGVQILLSFLRA